MLEVVAISGGSGSGRVVTTLGQQVKARNGFAPAPSPQGDLLFPTANGSEEHQESRFGPRASSARTLWKLVDSGFADAMNKEK
jgi:hypothetical protein